MRFWAFLAFLGGCYALQSHSWGRNPSDPRPPVPRPRESQSQLDLRARSLALQRAPEQNWCLRDSQRRTNLQQILTNTWDRSTPVYDSQSPGTRPMPIGQVMPGGGAFRGPGVPRVASVSAPPPPAPVPRQSSFTGWTGPMVPRFQGMSSYDRDRRTYQPPPPSQYQYAPRFDPTTPLPSDEIFQRLSGIPGLRAIPSGEINVRTELFRWRGIYVMRTVEAEPSVVSLLIVLTRVAETMSRIQGPPVLLHHDVEFDVATGNLYRTQIWTSRTSLRDYVGYDPPRPIRYLPIAYRGFLDVLERLPEAPPAARIPSPTRGGGAGVPSISSGIVTGRPRHRGALYSPPPSPPRPAPPPPKPKKIVPPYPTDTPTEDADADDTCCICCERVQNTRYIPCKHQFCFSCTEEIRKTTPFKCPTCRCVVDNYGKIPSDSD